MLQGQAALPAAELFRRHPQLHAFLGAQLAEAAAGLSGRGIGDASGVAGSGAKDAGSGRGGAALHPSLLPVLTLLSRLGWASEAVLPPLSTEGMAAEWVWHLTDGQAVAGARMHAWP